jgi:protein EFR3
VLTILDSVLRSKDINMIEESVPTFETYCKYVNAPSLSADQERATHYQSIVLAYSNYASRDHLSSWRAQQDFSMLIRWRTAGLRAIRAIVGSEAFSSDSGKQLNTVMPVILENLRLEDGDILASLQQRAQTGERTDFENARKRRMSMSTVATVDTIEADPATASGTTADADKVAEDEVRVLAVRCLKQIFAAGTGSSRGQIRMATTLTLRFIALRYPQQTSLAQDSQLRNRNGNWATSLIEAVTRWTPVQDRFIVVVTAMETLVRSPIIESMLEKQLALATMIDWLLSSSINLIGLSVMDVLLGFIHHTLLLLQLGGRDSKILPHHQQSDAVDLFRGAQEQFNEGSPFIEPGRGRDRATTESTPSPIRQELLLRLQKCIGDLATHIYYTDQVSDMMAAILARLKPSPQSDITSTAAAIDDPSAAARAIAKSVSLQEDPATDGFFSFATARVTALRAIKDILVIANLRKTATGAPAEARSRVGVQVWEGTQWLLRDGDPEVRRAYVDALLTWLRLETNKTDLHLPKDVRKKKSTKPPKKDGKDADEGKLSKRAVSNASRKEAKPSRSTFLQLLHLAIFDNALESPENGAEIMLLHLLLTTLIERLGVNATRTGLPMIFKLQEVVLNNEVVESAIGRANIASLVHGYLWALTEKFDFETTKLGTEIHAEVSRRHRHSLWLKSLKIPAAAIDHIPLPNESSEMPSQVSDEAIGAIKPFLNGPDLVDAIAAAYDESLVTPPNSPPQSPGRVFSVPTLGFGYGYGVQTIAKPSSEDQLPEKVKLEMLAEWTREGCIAAVERESNKAASLSGSRAGTSGTRQHLGINGLTVADTPSGRDSPANGKDIADSALPAYGLFGGLSSLQKLRRTNSGGGSPVPLTASSSHESTLRVADLKRALSGHQSTMRHASPLRRPVSERDRSLHSSGSESMVSYSDHGDSAIGVAPPDGIGPTIAPSEANGSGRPQSAGSKLSNNQSGTFHDQTTLPNSMSDPRLGNDIPPVPKIPSSLNLPGTFPRDTSPVRPDSIEQNSAKTQQRVESSPRSQNTGVEIASARQSRSMRRGDSRPTSRRELGGIGLTDFNKTSSASKMDLSKLLAGIHTQHSAIDTTKPGEAVVGVRPPY